MANSTPKRLGTVETFLRKLYNTATDDENIAAPGQIFSKKGFGSVVLNPEEAAEYREVVSGLMKGYAKDKLLSRRAVEVELRDAVFSAFGRPGAKRTSFERRLAAALQNLDAQLRREATSYTVFMPVAGARPDGLPFTFGKLRFVEFNESQLRKFRSATRKHQVPALEMKQRLEVVNRLRSGELWNQPCALVQVKARDQRAADEIARRETQDTLDALNFFADLTPYQHGRLYLPGARESRSMTAPVLEESGGWSMPHSRAGPIAPFEFDKLRQATNLQPIVRRIHNISKSEGIREVEDLLLTAVRWAGRAAIEIRREHAFLLYAIALESAVLPGGNTEQLGYRLRMRVAHLLETQVEKRNDLVRRVRDLYNIRSKIVHSGWYQLSDEDLERIRWICKAVLLRLLTHRSLSGMSSVVDLEAWFERQMLR